MRKPAGILGSMAKRARRNATIGATKMVYMGLYGEKPKRSKKK